MSQNGQKGWAGPYVLLIEKTRGKIALCPAPR